ncbi:putative ankyrin repeat protein [Botrytis fragariae]|uniref:Putative ankyrin repeat protein n=1 Tax=Botrytis fragariae TaxID=1964551 RepID=A0A8H6EE07_9HELO|nr:putative ankyrin repeat protein [Botrytis fragariae]KAF5868696.1 putative ankyrin repeat protein [Botrytis fragariae]
MARNAKTIVKLACGPLLEIANDETVQIIHHSFTEFLLDSERAQHNPSGSFPQFPALDQNSAHECLVLNCLAYMQSGTLSNAVSISNDVSNDRCSCDWSIATLYSIGFRKAKLDHPLLDYAIRNWTYHGNNYDIEDESIFNAGIRFITKDSVIPSTAHVAAFSGMSSYLKLLLSKTENINSKDTGGLELLLQHRAVLDNEDDSHLRPIHEAARRNFALIVLAPLEAGVNPTRSTDDHSRPDSEVCYRSREGEPGAALDYMCANGHTETILVTVPFLETRGIEEALWRYLTNRKSAAVRATLTDTNVSLSCVCTGTTTLYAATMDENPTCVEQVLIRDADPNAFSEPRLLDRRQHSAKPQDRNHFQSTALHVLTERWGDDNRVHANEQIFNLLVKYGANLEAKDSNGHTPLWLCFISRSNAFTTDEKGHGPVYHVLAQTKDVELLKLLIHHGADVSQLTYDNCDAISTNGESCLEALFAYKFTTRDTDSFDTTIQFLVKNGARCDYCTDKETKRHCLLLLNKDTKEKMMKFNEEILLSGVSLKERDEKGCTALI